MQELSTAALFRTLACLLSYALQPRDARPTMALARMFDLHARDRSHEGRVRLLTRASEVRLTSTTPTLERCARGAYVDGVGWWVEREDRLRGADGWRAVERSRALEARLRAKVHSNAAPLVRPHVMRPACRDAAVATHVETDGGIAPPFERAPTLRDRALDGRPAARRSAAAPSWIRHGYLCEQTEESEQESVASPRGWRRVM